MKRLGPELKMPKLKMPKLGSSSLKSSSLNAPPFLADVYYDLRDRRLLPLVALIAIAILAVPFLLGNSEDPVSDANLGAIEPTDPQPAGDTTLAVVESTPGLRDYRKRLKGRTPTDPFIQKYTSVPPTSQLKSVGGGGSSSGEGSALTDPGSGSSGSGAPTSSPPSGGDGGSAGSPEDGGGAPGPSGKTPSGKGQDNDERRYYAYRPDVRFGVAGSEELRTLENLPLASLLPKKNPVVIFIGATEDGKRVVFDVSPEVTNVRDGGSCVGGRQECGLLFMRKGEAVTLMTSGRAYRLAVDSIDFVEVERPKPASASASKEQSMPAFSQRFSK